MKPTFEANPAEGEKRAAAAEIIAGVIEAMRADTGAMHANERNRQWRIQLGDALRKLKETSQ